MYDGGGGTGSWDVPLAVDISLLLEEEILAKLCLSNFFKTTMQKNMLHKEISN